MKTAEEILSKHTGETGIYLTHGMIRGSDALEAMGEYLQQSYASQPMSAEPYTLDNGMGTATLMRTEQVEELDKYRKNAEEDYLTTPISVLRYITGLERVTKATIPTVKDGWVSVEDVREIWDFANAQYNIIKTQKESAKNSTEIMCLSFTANCIVDIMDEISGLIQPLPTPPITE